MRMGGLRLILRIHSRSSTLSLCAHIFDRCLPFSAVVEDVRIHNEDDHCTERPRDSTPDPAKATMWRASRKLDTVGMAVERRLWTREVTNV